MLCNIRVRSWARLAQSLPLALSVALSLILGAAPARAAEAEAPSGATLEAHGFLAARQGQSDPLPPDHWSAEENVLWKTDLPGLGWSSPVVTGGKVYLTTCVSSGKEREPKKGLYLDDLNANLYPKETDSHAYKVYCLDLSTGSLLWEKTLHEGVPPKPHHIKNSLASETPSTDGKRLLVYFGNIGLYCLDLEGQEQWKLEMTPRETQQGWGTSISPVIHEGRVYLVNDNEEQSQLQCLNAADGSELWSVAREEKTNYSTPYLWKNSLRTELVMSAVNYARSYDLDGKLLWQLKGRSILAIPVPQEHAGLLLLTSGHVVWGESPMYGIRPGASGDLSPDPEGKAPLSDHLAWYNPGGGPYHPTPIVVGEQMFVLHDRGFLASYDPRSGREIYGKQRLGIANFTSSPWSYGGKVFCVNEDGVTAVVEAGPEYRRLHDNRLAEDDMCMATPLVLGNRLLIRSAARVYCIGQR